MAEFTSADLRGSRFENVTLAGSRFHNVDLSGVLIRGAYAADLEIDGELEQVRVNGVDVMPLVEAELDRRQPDRAKMRPTSAEEFREAWAILERLWPETVERARRLPEARLHERVDGEWSFIETLRHLVFATDAWVLRTMLGDPAPYHPLDLPHTEMDDHPGVPNDPDARPSLDEVLGLRTQRMGVVRKVLAELSDERLAGRTEPVAGPGYPDTDSYDVRRCLFAIVNEEWHHRLFAERDLAVLEASA